MESGETRQLFERARHGSAEAWDALYRRSATKLLAIIRLRMGPALRAEVESRDILQTVFLKSVREMARLESPATLMAWMARIAENEIRDQVDFKNRQRRDAARKVPLDAEALDLPAPARQALSQAIFNERREQLERALESLPAPYREAIVLRKLEELSFPEMAVRLGRSEDACRMLFSRAMVQLTLALQPVTRP